jgi:general secretion pathway protein E
MDDFTRIAEALPSAITAARRRGVSSIAVLCEQGLGSADLLTTLVARRLGMQTLRDAEVDAAVATWDRIDAREATRRRVLPVRGVDGMPTVLIDDPWNDELLAWLPMKLGQRPVCVLATPDALKRKLELESNKLGRIDDAAERPSRTATGTTAIAGDSAAAARPGRAVQFVQDAIEQGWTEHASDVHFEATRTGLQLKFRLDGLLVDQNAIDDPELAAEVISRVKVMAELDIAERRVPQDGRFSIELGGRSVDCRVSIMPSAHGEDAVVRILDKRHLAAKGTALTLASLGFDTSLRSAVARLGRAPHGMLLVTGPTGSGKTTTLYALLSEIRTGTEKIVTIEDPIEYELRGVLQVPVNEKKGLTFARGLRSVLRHDPDVIMVGEIRDRETADIAIQSALTGHLVFTTVHANTAFDVVSRFTHMGVDLYGFVSCLNGVLAQRLIRLNCPHCAAPDPDQTGALMRWADRAIDLEGAVPRRGHGCAECRGTGYLGRTAIGEVLLVDDRLRDMLVTRAPLVTVKEYVAAQGAMSIRQAAAEMIAAGRTTVDEVARVVAVA